MDQELTTVQVPSPPSRGPSVLVALVVALVALAILKPWSIGGAGAAVTLPPASPAAGSPASGPPAASPEPAIWDPNAMACMSSEGDRLLALARGPGLEVRSWLVIGDASLSDPLDPAAVALRLPSTHVIGLGVCARRVVQSAAAGSAAELVDVEAVTQGPTSTLTDRGAPRVITRQLGIPYLGVLYGPPPSLSPVAPSSSPGSSPDAGPSPADAGLPTWPVGTYALAFRFPGDGPGVLRWVRLDILQARGKYD